MPHRKIAAEKQEERANENLNLRKMRLRSIMPTITQEYRLGEKHGGVTHYIDLCSVGLIGSSNKKEFAF